MFDLMSEVTHILSAIEHGDPSAAGQLLPLVYDELPAVDEALQQLAEEDPLCAELVKLRFFAGLTLEEAAATLGIARRTADRYWAFARSWLYDALSKADKPDES
jgi:DNA-directed RNA polymerase specialized sigma24 family protein